MATEGTTGYSYPRPVWYVSITWDSLRGREFSLPIGGSQPVVGSPVLMLTRYHNYVTDHEQIRHNTQK